MTTFTVEQIKKINELASELVRSGRAANMARAIDMAKGMLLGKGLVMRSAAEMGDEIEKIKRDLKKSPIPKEVDDSLMGTSVTEEKERIPEIDTDANSNMTEVDDIDTEVTDEEEKDAERLPETDIEEDAYSDMTEIDDVARHQQHSELGKPAEEMLEDIHKRHVEPVESMHEIYPEDDESQDDAGNAYDDLERMDELPEDEKSSDDPYEKDSEEKDEEIIDEPGMDEELEGTSTDDEGAEEPNEISGQETEEDIENSADSVEIKMEEHAENNDCVGGVCPMR